MNRILLTAQLGLDRLDTLPGFDCRRTRDSAHNRIMGDEGAIRLRLHADTVIRWAERETILRDLDLMGNLKELGYVG
jgi:hypothetical protein